jgi:hypothetical protein
MKRAAAAAVAAVALVCAASAGATTQKLSPTEQNLQRQITALQGQVKTLNKQVKTLKTQVTTASDIAVLSGAIAICGIAATADTFTATFNVIDQIAQGTQGKTYIGPQQGLSDQGICQALKVTRSTTLPPSLAEFSALLGLIAPSAVFDAARSFARATWSAFTPRTTR